MTVILSSKDKVNIFTKNNVIDVQDEHLIKATTNIGSLVIPDVILNDKRKINEINAGKWLFDTFGGNVELLEEVNKKNICTSDCIWNGKKWEFKNPLSYKKIEKRLKHALEDQLQSDNVGGLLLDISDTNGSIINIIDVATKTISINAIVNTDVIIKKRYRHCLYL